MDKVLFVQNIKEVCKVKGIKPTVACRESGVGTSFINNIEARGQVPSVEKVQMLAAYLGVTTSELLGEEKEPATIAERVPAGLDELGRIYGTLNDEGREKLLDYAADLEASGRYIKSNSAQLGKTTEI